MPTEGSVILDFVFNIFVLMKVCNESCDRELNIMMGVCIWKSTSPWEWPPCSSSWWTPRTYKRADPRRASDLRYLIQFTDHKEDDPPMPVPMVRMFPLNETLLMPQPELREGIFLTDCNVISWSVLSESIANEFRRIKNHLQCSWVKEICMRLASHSIPGQ